MISKLRNPLVVAVLSIVLSVGAGLYVIWNAALPIIAHSREGRLTKKVDEEKKTKARGWDFWTIEMESLSSELKEEKARMKKQDDQQRERGLRLAAEEKELAKVRTEIETLRKEIADKVIELSADELKNLRTLAQTYTSLSPKAVVAIFREMDDTTATKILSLMKPDTVGPIFEEMSKTAGTDGPLAKRAAILSEKLRLLKAAKVTPTS